jgi:hypothetical protein
MKKRSKWVKWQVGAVGVLGLAFLFQEVKASPVFSQAVAEAHAVTSGSNQLYDGTTSQLDNSTNATGDQWNQNQQQMDQNPFRGPGRGQGPGPGQGSFDNSQRTSSGQS